MTCSNHIRRIISGCISLVLLSFLSFTASALELSEQFTLNGFYSLNAGLSQGDDVTLPGGSPNKPNTLNEDEVNFDSSLIGLQGIYAFTDNLQFTLQAISTGLTEDEYSPTVEWAYLSYQLDDDLKLRAGRFKPPFLRGTELRNVGFSRLWVRPLVSNNGTAGFDNYDGVDAIKAISLSEYNIEIHAAYGKADHQQDFIDNHDVQLLSLQIEKDSSWVKLGLFQATYDAYNNTGSRLIKGNAKAQLYSIETEQIFDNFILNLGYASGEIEISPDEEISYLSVAYRSGRLTPYVLYQSRMMSFEPATLPPGPAPLITPKNGKYETDSYSIGFRYDLGDRYSIKAEIENQSISDATGPGDKAVESESNIYSIVLEGMF